MGSPQDTSGALVGRSAHFACRRAPLDSGNWPQAFSSASPPGTSTSKGGARARSSSIFGALHRTGQYFMAKTKKAAAASKASSKTASAAAKQAPGKGAASAKDEPLKRKLGLRGAAPWAARHAAKHAAEARARAAEPPLPGSARATIRTPENAEGIKQKVRDLHAALSQIKTLRKNLAKTFFDIGVV